MRNFKMQLIQAHVVMSSFIFPAAILFIVTGVSEIWKIGGSKTMTSVTVHLPSPVPTEMSDLIQIIERELSERELHAPTGNIKRKSESGESITLIEWHGAAREVRLTHQKGYSVATIDIIENDLYKRMVQLHKSKGGLAFKIYSTLVAFVLFFVLATGVVMIWQSRKLRNYFSMSFLFGTMLFGVLAIYS